MSSSLRLTIVVLAGLLLTALGVAPQLQAHLTGHEYTFRVEPVDPIDPFRGAYVDLNYPDLRAPGSDAEDPGSSGLGTMPEDQQRGDVFIVLRKSGDVWVAAAHERERPAHGPYLACNDTDWRIRCGIGSWFVPQDEARKIERKVADGHATATVKIDSRGHAVLVGLD